MAKKRAPRAKKGSAESPTSSCLILCDDVLSSGLHGKHYIHGIINHIRVATLPIMIGPMAAYVRMSNVYEGAVIDFKFTNLTTDEMVFGLKAKAEGSPGPLAIITLVMQIPAFEIRESGRYSFSGSLGHHPAFVESVITVESASESPENH